MVSPCLVAHLSGDLGDVLLEKQMPVWGSVNRRGLSTSSLMNYIQSHLAKFYDNLLMTDWGLCFVVGMFVIAEKCIRAYKASMVAFGVASFVNMTP